VESIVATTSEDGYIQNGSTVTKTATAVRVSTSSSSDTNSFQGFWFFDTSGIPDHAQIIKVVVSFYVIFISGTSSQFVNFYMCDDACNGSTLDSGDWGTPSGNSKRITTFLGSESTGAKSYVTFPALGVGGIQLRPLINKSGYTCVRAHAGSDDANPITVLIAADEHTTQDPMTLTITYIIPNKGLTTMGAGRA
jgi:hypothetical protein